jgi:hypothetical protein
MWQHKKITEKKAFKGVGLELVLPSGIKNTPKIAIFRMCYGENGTVKSFGYHLASLICSFFTFLQENSLKITSP